MDSGLNRNGCGLFRIETRNGGLGGDDNQLTLHREYTDYTQNIILAYRQISPVNAIRV